MFPYPLGSQLELRRISQPDRLILFQCFPRLPRVHVTGSNLAQAPLSWKIKKGRVAERTTMSKTGSGADLRKFMEKRLDLKLTANRHVVGVLRGYDQFMNIVLDNTVEIVSPTEKNEIGMVVIRGNSIMMWECLDRVK
eukprot:s40_g4.t1